MVQLAAIIASQAINEYRAMLGAALTVGVTPVEVKEIVYQAVPYVGLAKVFDFLHATNEVLTERGIELPLPRAVGVDVRRRVRKSAWRCRTGSSARTRSTGMYAAAADDEAHFQRYLSANCFGDYVARSGIDLKSRELLTFSMLVALGGADAQVRGHVAGNLNVGNDRATLLAVLTQLLPFIGYPRTLNGLAAVNAITPTQGEMTVAHRIWLITGISSGFGRHLTEQLLDRGDYIVGTVRNPQSVVDLNEKYPDLLRVEVLDVRDTDALRAVVDRTVADLGRMDVVISNAGYGVFGAAEELSDAQVDGIIATNLTASIQLIRAVLPHMRAAGGGRVIQLSTYGGQVAFPGQLACTTRPNSASRASANRWRRRSHRSASA